jgi:type I restriction enzyme, S subunit
MSPQHDWPRVPLGSLAKFRNGLNYNKDSFGSGLKVINVKDFGDLVTPDFDELGEINPMGLVRNDDLLQEDDIVFVRSNGNRDLIGRSLFITNYPRDLSHSAFTIRVRFTSNEVVPRFYAYLFRSRLIRQVLTAHGGGTNISNLNQGILRDLQVPLPPLSTQRKIASVLSAYDNLIENNTRRIEILEEMAQAIYREWFVHYRFPGHEKVEMVDSPLGPIPEGWEVTPFSSVGDFINGYAFKPKHWGDSGKPIVKIAELKNGVTRSTPRYPGEDIAPKYHIQNGDLLFSWSADLDAYIWSGGEALLNQHLFNVVPKVEISRLFLFYALKDRMPDFRSRSQGTTMRHIKRSALDEVKLTVPPSALRSEFDHYVEPIIKQVENLQAKNTNLRRTQDLLLPKLISGEIDLGTQVIRQRGVLDEF